MTRANCLILIKIKLILFLNISIVGKEVAAFLLFNAKRNSTSLHMVYVNGIFTLCQMSING